MRICVVGPSKRFYSGLSAYAIIMANAFRERGHAVFAVLFRNLVPHFIYPGKGRVGKGKFRLDFNAGIDVYHGMDWNAPGTWIGAWGFLRKARPEALIIQWWTSSVAHMQIFLALARHLLGQKPYLVLEMHEVADPLEEKILPIRLYSRLAGRLLIRLCDAYVVHSSAAKGAVKRIYHIPEEKIHIVPHGSYGFYETLDSAQSKKGLGVEGFVILFFGMIRRYKGVPLLVRAFDMLPQHVAAASHLVIAGEDWGDDPELHQAVAGSRYRERITFRPQFIPDELVSQYFSAADVVVLPYLRSYGSGVANIAIAQGKPVIMSDTATLRESFKDYGGSNYFPAGDSEALRDALLKAHESWLKEGCRRHVFHNNDWGCVIQRYEKILVSGGPR
jgi:glycosyltransferase involved in cell wall biosynthesis